MAKFPSLLSVLHTTQKTIQRFPLETLTAVVGTVCAFILLQKEYNESGAIITKTIMSCSLCLVLFLSLSLFFEASNKNKTVRFITSFVFASLVTAFVFNFKKEISSVELQQYLVLNIAFHLLVSFAGFIPKKYNQEEFWEFNKRLFLRILTAGLYSVVLYSGLALAILALKNLFTIPFDEKIYGYLYFIIAGIFNTLFFLHGVPETPIAQNSLSLNYPNGLKKFTQYLLIPLISIYLAILICYEVKIIATLSLPVGWVSYLVLIFAIFGILSFLLVHPIANKAGNLWMQTFNKWFYYLLIPLLGLLYWAILHRINLYGFTHERYYVLLLSIWLTVVVTYFLLVKQPKIKFIPISLCIAGSLSIIGPQSANAISKNSQLRRFETYMKSFKDKELSFDQEKDLSSIIDFLEENYGVNIFLPYTNNKLTALFKKDKKPNSSQIMEALGYEYHSEFENNKDTNFYYNFYQNDTNTIKNIHGYDFDFLLSNYSNLSPKQPLQVNNKTYNITSIKKQYGVNLKINQDVIALRIYDFINHNKGFNHSNNDKEIIEIIETPKYSLQLTYIIANGTMQRDKKIIDEYQIRVLVGIKND